MTDTDIEEIQTVNIDITAESIDAHVICLRRNGYKVLKRTSAYTHYLLAFLAGAFIVASVLQ